MMILVKRNKKKSNILQLEVFPEKGKGELFTLSFDNLGKSWRATKENLDFSFVFFVHFLKELRKREEAISS